MANLRLMKGRPTWHANIRKADGTRTVVNLGVPVRGTPPRSLREKSKSVAFEISRAKAEAALAQLEAELADERAAIRAQENVIRLKGGNAAKAVRLSDLAKIAGELSGGAKAQRRDVEGRAGQFAEYMLNLKGNDVPLSAIKGTDVQAFFDSLTESKSTFNRRLIELRRLFRECLPIGTPTPFEAEKKADRPIMPEHIQADTDHHRKPFTAEEMKRIYEAAKDTRIYGPIVFAAGCGLRKGDACCLKWESVDQKAGAITITPRKTRKHGKEVSIPLPPRALELLKNRLPVRTYVFPEVAETYLSGKTGQDRLTDELKNVLDKALTDEGATDEPELKSAPPAEAFVKCIQYTDTMTTTEQKKARFREVARLYLIEGLSYNQIQGHGIAKAQTSEALREMEGATGIQLRRNPTNGKGQRVRDLTTEKPKGRLRRQSVRDWHSFRVTWITEALKAGWSIADVKICTGHSETEIVLRHYHKPDMKHLKSLPVPASAAI